MEVTWCRQALLILLAIVKPALGRVVHSSPETADNITGLFLSEEEVLRSHASLPRSCFLIVPFCNVLWLFVVVWLAGHWIISRMQWRLIHKAFQWTQLRIRPTVPLLSNSYSIFWSLAIILFIIDKTLTCNSLFSLWYHVDQFLLLESIEVVLRVTYVRLHFDEAVC